MEDGTAGPTSSAVTRAEEYLAGIGLPKDTFDALAAEIAVAMELTGGNPSPAQQEEYAEMRRALVRARNHIALRTAVTPGPIAILAGGGIAWLLWHLRPAAPGVTATMLLVAASWVVVAFGRLAFGHLRTAARGEHRPALLALEGLAAVAAFLAIASTVRWIVALGLPVSPALALALYGLTRRALVEAISTRPPPTPVLTR